jgi:hypothetical protein
MRLMGAAGEAFCLTKSKATAASAFQMYEFHSTQQGAQICPGHTFSLDYFLCAAEELELAAGNSRI